MKKELTWEEAQSFVTQISQHILGQSLEMMDVRQEICENIVWYAAAGYLPGGFLQAVLSNDLFDAMDRADVYNRQHIYNIVRLIYNELPNSSYGSYDAVRDYSNRHSMDNLNTMWMEHIMAKFTDEDIVENPQ